MTIKIEDAKELLPIVKALAEGKMIQDKIEGLTDWCDTDEINLEYNGQKIKHRIKPEKKYRPFKTKKECWDEMMKHRPFGWLIHKTKDITNSIGSITEKTECNGFVYISFATKENESFSAEFLFENYKFADGTPFGIEEEKDNRIN